MPAITDKTRKMLWGRSGGICAICKKQLLEGEEDSEDPSILGQECHIVGEENSIRSPRGIHPMPLAERNLYSNLVLLCRDHHKIIDDQTDHYTVDLLLQIKTEHTVWVKQTLNFDESKQSDDETYLDIARKWSLLAGLDDWDNFTYLVTSGSSPSIKADRREQLAELSDWLFKRVFPRRYSELDAAFLNFRRILNDFLNEFSLHLDIDAPESRYSRTRKFYKISNWDPEMYERLGREYGCHCQLLSDFAAELTRAANYICDLMRLHVYRGFRLREGHLIVRTGVWEDGMDRQIRTEYLPAERTGTPYPGRDEFLTTRLQRDFHF